MKKSICFLLGFAMSSVAVIGDIKIPREFKDYKRTRNIIRDVSLPSGSPIRFIEYDINGDKKPDVKEIYPMVYYGGWRVLPSPAIYCFDKNGSNKFEPGECQVDENANGWEGYKEWKRKIDNKNLT